MTAKTPAKTPEVKKIAPPPPTITIQLNGETREFKMSFGLLNEIARAVGGIEEIQILLMDNDRLLNLLNLVIANRDEKGRIQDDSVDLSVGDAIDPETYEELVKWTMGHTMGFFVRRTRALTEASQGVAPEMIRLNKLANGLLD